MDTIEQIRIIPMERRHVPHLARLEKLCFAEPWSEKALEEELDNPQAVFLAAESLHGEVLGYAGMHDILGEGYIDNIAVFPQARGSGIGSALVKALCSYGADKGLAFITLEVRPSNVPALALYQKFGFQEKGRRRNFYRRPAEDALILTKHFPGNNRPAGEERKRDG